MDLPEFLGRYFDFCNSPLGMLQFGFEPPYFLYRCDSRLDDRAVLVGPIDRRRQLTKTLCHRVEERVAATHLLGPSLQFPGAGLQFVAQEADLVAKGGDKLPIRFNGCIILDCGLDNRGGRPSRGLDTVQAALLCLVITNPATRPSRGWDGGLDTLARRPSRGLFSVEDDLPIAVYLDCPQASPAYPLPYSIRGDT